MPRLDTDTERLVLNALLYYFVFISSLYAFVFPVLLLRGSKPGFPFQFTNYWAHFWMGLTAVAAPVLFTSIGLGYVLIEIWLLHRFRPTLMRPPQAVGPVHRIVTAKALRQTRADRPASVTADCRITRSNAVDRARASPSRPLVEAVTKLAWTDELTGLMNRASFKEVFRKALEVLPTVQLDAQLALEGRCSEPTSVASS